MKTPAWVQKVEWLRNLAKSDLFQKYMLPNILNDEVHSKHLIDKISRYYEKLQNRIDLYPNFSVNLAFNVMIFVDIYITTDARKNITEVREKLKTAANLADALASVLNEINDYQDTFVFVYPASLKKLLDKQGYIAGIDADPDRGDTEILLKNMAVDLRNTYVGTPTLEWIDDHNATTDYINVITRVLEDFVDPPSGIVAAFIYLCFGTYVEESAIQKFNSPSRKKHYETNTQHIKI